MQDLFSFFYSKLSSFLMCLFIKTIYTYTFIGTCSLIFEASAIHSKAIRFCAFTPNLYDLFFFADNNIFGFLLLWHNSFFTIQFQKIRMWPLHQRSKIDFDRKLSLAGEVSRILNRIGKEKDIKVFLLNPLNRC